MPSLVKFPQDVDPTVASFRHFIQILLAVEKEFKMEIPNNALNDINTMGDVMRLIEQPPLQRRELFPSINFDELPPNLYIQR